MENDFSQFYESALGNLKRPKQIERIVCYILKKGDHTSITNRLFSDQIIQQYKKLREQDDNIILIPDNSITTILSQLAQDSESPIYCTGRKQGYYYKSSNIEDPAGISDSSCVEFLNESKEQNREKELYPLFAQWLSYSCDRVCNIADKRKMHKWGNPDILGMNIYYIIGIPKLEITTIEVKREICKWRVDIFEAVAHTLFSNKVYYACVCKESEFEKNNKDMLLYAQKFQIGLLVLVEDDNDQSQELKPEMIREIMPAPYRESDLKMRNKFLESIEVRTPEDVLKIGQRNDSGNNLQ